MISLHWFCLPLNLNIVLLYFEILFFTIKITPKKGKKDKNDEYCRQKVKLRRLQLRNFDKKYRKKEAIRKASYRTKRKQQQICLRISFFQ